MIRSIQKACWRFRVWRIRRQADRRIRETQARIDRARKQHKPVKHLFEQLKAIRNEGLSNG